MMVILQKKFHRLQKALTQIHERHYQEYLLNDNRKDIRLYGIAFCKKRCKAMTEVLPVK